MTRMIKGFKLTDDGERKLFTTKLKKEIDTLDNWFQEMADKVCNFIFLHPSYSVTNKFLLYLELF